MKTWERKILIASLIFLPLIVLIQYFIKFNGESPASSSETAPIRANESFNYLPLVNNPALAIPGAEGFGRDSLGGRGGKVIEVTNLNNDGVGSFRAAVNTDGPRIIVFRIGGTIELKTSVTISKPYITIAGQTAPGGGITLKSSPLNTGGALIVATHDVIIQYIRSRPGPPQAISSNGDALEILGPDAYRIIIDHCSFSWAIDEVVSTWYNAHNITIQWSIISEGLNCSTHAKGCHSMGLLLGSEGSHSISIHHNLFVHNDQRNPLIETSGIVDVVNNIVADTGHTPITVLDIYGAVPINIVGNLYKQTIFTDNEYFVSAVSEGGPGIKVYVKGNISPTRPNDSLDEVLVVKPTGRQWIVSTWNKVPVITSSTAFVAYDQVLAGAGATIGIDALGNKFYRRDPVDIRVVNDVINGISRIINDPSEVGGWPILSSGSAPIDTDKDGMPNAWEDRYGFNSSNPADGSADADQDGFTNIEEYLNGTNPIS